MPMRTSGFAGSAADRKKRRIIIAFTVLVIGVLMFFSIRKGMELIEARQAIAGEAVSVADLWEQNRYSDVSAYAEARLAESPLDGDALLYAGYSRFYLAISRLSTQERHADLDACIRYLRLLKVRGDSPKPERIDYVLGKAYLTKGPYWADLAVQYLKQSLEAGYIAEDSYEHLGRAYSALGDLEGALLWYKQAAAEHPTDRLLITLGEEAFKMGLYDDAARYYQEAINSTRDESLEKRGLSQLGQLYYDVGNYAMARVVLEDLVGKASDNKDYLFLLGETYFQLGMNAKARQTWFAVTRIDPRHVGALRRLYD